VTPQQFLEVIKFGLPGVEVLDFDHDAMCASVCWCGECFDIAATTLDSHPVLLVTTPAWEINEKTGKVLSLLDDMMTEVVGQRPWVDAKELLRRLRELAEEGEDDDV
jgi:hypothetical protein